jgi:hypothetical protein
MDVVLIIMMCIISLLLLYVNLYLLALYCHPEDGGFGSSCVSKVIVVLYGWIILGVRTDCELVHTFAPTSRYIRFKEQSVAEYEAGMGDNALFGACAYDISDPSGKLLLRIG